MSTARNEEFDQQSGNKRNSSNVKSSKTGDDKGIGVLGYTIVFSMLFSEIFFITLLIMSYFSKTKPFVDKVLGLIL